MHTDQAGKKLQIGSTVSTCKPGCDRYTIKGRVVNFEEEHLVMLDFRTQFKRAVPYDRVKRIRYKGKPNEADVNF